MRSTRANIHIKNLIKNYTVIKNKCGKSYICAAVKADAYGHGALKISKILEEQGCNYFGVATTIEAKELIIGGIKKPIILLSLVTPEETATVVKLGIEPVVTSLDYIKLIEKEAVKQKKNISVHLKIDTGMGRIGCRPQDSLGISQYIKSSKTLKLKGICTHLSTSDSLNQDYTNSQIGIFKEAVNRIKRSGISPELIHCANSGGIILNNDTVFNMVRPGIVLYGYPPSKELNGLLDIKPILELTTSIVDLKKVPKGSSISYGRTYTTEEDQYIATLPIGYADGYSRSLSNCGTVLINNRKYSIVGRVCMDQLMVKVDSTVKLYDKAILIGTEKKQPNAQTIANKTGTICYEVLTNIHRVKKYYIF